MRPTEQSIFKRFPGDSYAHCSLERLVRELVENSFGNSSATSEFWKSQDDEEPYDYDKHPH